MYENYAYYAGGLNINEQERTFEVGPSTARTKKSSSERKDDQNQNKIARGPNEITLKTWPVTASDDYAARELELGSRDQWSTCPGSTPMHAPSRTEAQFGRKLTSQVQVRILGDGEAGGCTQLWPHRL